MSVLFMDGFDLYSGLADVVKAGWYHQNANQTFSLTEGRFGGGCLKNSVNNSGFIAPLVVSTGDAAIICFAYYLENMAGGSAADTILTVFTRDGTQLFRLEQNASGDLKAYNNPNAQVGSTAAAALSNNQWHWIEVKVTFGTDAVTGSVEVKVNDISKITATGIDTFAATGNHASYVLFLGSAGAVRYDDVVLMDDNGATMNDFIGDSRINTMIPNSDGTTTDWTASAGSDYQAVDDTPNAANDDTDYVYATAANVTQLQMSNFPDTPPSAHVVQIRTRSSKPDAGDRTYRANLKSGATTSNGTTMGFTLGYVWRRNGLWETDPNTASAWTRSGVNAAQVELELLT